MSKIAVAVLFSLLASPAWASSYFLATAAGGGSDSNNGTSASTPWLTPNHAVNCGDVITAAASTAYSAANFASGKWGTVTCAAGNNVAWLQCATFDGCKISGMTPYTVNGMTITASYWGVQGWEVDGTTASGVCFFVTPVSFGPTVHHVVLANDIAVGCGQGGYEPALYPSGRSSVDYIAIVGSIAYGNSGGSHYCGSGISIYSPAASDTLPGTHIYVAGNFSWGNVNGNPCDSSTPTDGEGIIFDSFDQYYNGGSNAYAQQAVADNNMLLANGGRGLQLNNNNAGSVSSHVYFRHNTVWGNNTDLNQAPGWGGLTAEINLIDFNNTEAFQNIAVTNAIKGANGYPIYDFWATSPSTTDHVYQNVAYATSGTYSNTYEPGSFSYGPNNLFGTNPSFANATAPGAPSCGSYSSVPACMATVIANFTPTNAAAMGYGYQIPSTTQVHDPLFPQWLCNVNLPSGLVTMGCLAASSLPASPTITGVKIQ